MPDTLIHALKISAGLGMRVRRQIWETYIRSADALSMRGNSRGMETHPPTWGYDPTWRRWWIHLRDWELVGEEGMG